jgi:hypothetical protein
VTIELRPLGLGEILDRTFQLYRARFSLFLGIAAVSMTLVTLWSGLQLGGSSILVRNHIADPARQVITTVIAIVGWAYNFGCSALATAAVNRAVHAIYEGGQTGVAKAYGEVRRRWLTCVWVNILAFFIAWSPVILIVVAGVASVLFATKAKNLAQANAVGFLYGGAALLVVIAVPLCTWLSLRYALAVPACVQEGIGALSSLKRSVVLSKETRGRIFVLSLVVGTAWLVAFLGLLIPVYALAVKSHGRTSVGATIYTLVVSFVCGTLLQPVGAIGLPLFYYDARVRKEGFDVEWMLEHSSPLEIPAEPSAAPTGLIGE